MSLTSRFFRKADPTALPGKRVVATAESSDAAVDGSVHDALRSMRDRLGMDVVFVSEIVEGKRMFRFVDRKADAPPVEAGAADPLEATFCQRVVDGRLPGLIRDAASLPPGTDVPPTPFRVGAHLSTPIVLGDGRVYGTLCSFSTSPNPQLQESDLLILRRCAELVAKKLDRAAAAGLREPPPDWKLAPDARYESTIWR